MEPSGEIHWPIRYEGLASVIPLCLKNGVDVRNPRNFANETFEDVTCFDCEFIVEFWEVEQMDLPQRLYSQIQEYIEQ